MNVAIVLAGGTGTRMGRDIPKQFIVAGGKPILIHTLERFAECPEIDGILVVCVDSWRKYCRDVIREYGVKKMIGVISGGKTRRESSYAGCLAAERWLAAKRGSDGAFPGEPDESDSGIFENIPENDPERGINEQNCSGEEDYVLIHDAARPFADREIILRNLEAARKYGACETAVPMHDTVVRVKDGAVEEIVPREELYRVQTPQTFRLPLILEAHRRYDGISEITDDAGLLLLLGKKVAVAEGSSKNIKITTADDLELF